MEDIFFHLNLRSFLVSLNIVVTCTNTPSSPRYLCFTPEINLEKCGSHSSLPQVSAKPAGRILQSRPELNKEKHSHLWRNNIVVVELFLVVLCNPILKLFLVIYQLHRFKPTTRVQFGLQTHQLELLNLRKVA
jgi:hypothetical protein